MSGESFPDRVCGREVSADRDEQLVQAGEQPRVGIPDPLRLGLLLGNALAAAVGYGGDIDLAALRGEVQGDLRRGGRG